MTKRHRTRDVLDLMRQREGYRIGEGYEMMEQEEEFPTFEEDEELYGMSIEFMEEEDGSDDTGGSEAS